MIYEDILDPKGVDTEHLGKLLLTDERFKGKSILQIGARINGGWDKMFRLFKNIGYETFDILEIFRPNVDWLRTQDKFPVDKVVLGDARKIDEYEELRKSYDCIVAWHSMPGEHGRYEEIKPCIDKVMSMCNFLALGTPWGIFPQGPEFGNEHERHLSSLYPKDFESWGFDLCYTFNSGRYGPGPRDNMMYSIKFKK